MYNVLLTESGNTQYPQLPEEVFIERLAYIKPDKFIKIPMFIFKLIDGNYVSIMALDLKEAIKVFRKAGKSESARIILKAARLFKNLELCPKYH